MSVLHPHRTHRAAAVAQRVTKDMHHRKPHVTRHTPYVTFHMSHVTYHTSHANCHAPHLNGLIQLRCQCERALRLQRDVRPAQVLSPPMLWPVFQWCAPCTCSQPSPFALSVTWATHVKFIALHARRWPPTCTSCSGCRPSPPSTGTRASSLRCSPTTRDYMVCLLLEVCDYFVRLIWVEEVVGA